METQHNTSEAQHKKSHARIKTSNKTRQGLLLRMPKEARGWRSTVMQIVSNDERNDQESNKV